MIKISICIPTYNRADLLTLTLKSIDKQTEKPYEVIVVDNASTDATREVVKQKHKCQIIYIRNKKNIGMVGNYNKCIELASGDYISILHSDDLIAPSWYKIWNKTISGAKADIFTSSLCTIDIQNNPQFIFHTFEADTFIPKENALSQLIKHHCPMLAPNGATVFKLSKLKSVGKFREDYKTESDVDIFLKLVNNSNFFYKHKILFAHRSHEFQTFDNFKKKQSLEDKINRMLNYFKIINKNKINTKSDHLKMELLTETISMTMTGMNYYFLNGKFKGMINFYKNTYILFPDIFKSAYFWSRYIKIHLMQIQRYLGKDINLYINRKEVEWLKDFK